MAAVNQHWECAKALLEAGADPNGNEKNLCTPLAVMSQRGYYEGELIHVPRISLFIHLDRFMMFE